MLHFDEIVFGPIRSRRLGSSLGVNVLPTKAEVEQALEVKLSELSKAGTEVDSITFSGNGEPTVNPDFAAIVDATVRMRDKYYPSAKISVLSNATMLGHKDVFDALKKVDNPIMKIDASSDELIAAINRPQGTYSLDHVIEKLAGFEGDFVLQTMFLHSDDFDAHTEEVLEECLVYLAL